MRSRHGRAGLAEALDTYNRAAPHLREVMYNESEMLRDALESKPPEPKRKRPRVMAMLHCFGPELVCSKCSTTWQEHQEDPMCCLKPRAHIRRDVVGLEGGDGAAGGGVRHE